MVSIQILQTLVSGTESSIPTGPNNHPHTSKEKQGFSRCYLETTDILKAAIGLYEKLGFEFIDKALGNTGHSDCEIRMLKSLWYFL